MAIDPNIALGVRPAQISTPDPIEQYGKVMQLKTLLGQQQLQGIQTQQAQYGLQDQENLRNYFAASPDLSTPEGQAGVLKAAPTLGPGLLKNLLEPAVQRSTISLNNSRAGSFDQEAIAKATATHRDQLANVTDLPSAQQWVLSGYQDKTLGPVVSQAGPPESVMAKIPDPATDPQGFQNWKNQAALGATKFIELNKPTLTNQRLGATDQIVATPGLGGAPSVLSSTATTQSPDSAASVAQSAANAKLAADTARRGQNLTDARAKVGQNIEAVKADPFGALGINKNVSPTAAAGAGLSGNDYLATLPTGFANQVKALNEGRLAITPQFLRSPEGSALLNAAMQYEPGTDQTTYISRAATAKDAASGKLATSNNALNTVAGHFAGLADSADALGNTALPWVNTVKNFVGSNIGTGQDAKVNAFNLNLQGVADELERAYRGAGGSEGAIQQWRATLGSSSSPASFKAALAKGAEMLQSKLDANQAQYNQGMSGKVGNYSTITPTAAAALAKLRGLPAPGATTQGAATNAAPAAPQTFNSPPDPAAMAGKVMSDTSTNPPTVYVSDGKQWVRKQ